MRSAVISLLKRKDVLERFKEVLRENPEKYVLVTETGEEFILDSEEELSRLVEGGGLRTSTSRMNLRRKLSTLFTAKS